MAMYRKKPVVIEAVQLLWSTWSEMCDFANVGHLSENRPEGVWLDEDGNITDSPQVHRNKGTLGLAIPTLEGTMLGREGDYIIKGVQGEFYPCKPDIFEQTYELADIQPDLLVAQQEERLARWHQEQEEHDRA